MERSSSGNSWITTDFDDDDDDFFAQIDTKKLTPMTTSTSKKRPRNGSTSVPIKIPREASTWNELWSGRHAPKLRSDSAVHPKKLEEVADWVKKQLQKGITKNPRILCLKGPPGSGKTSVIHTLSHELNYSIHEWSAPAEVVAFHKRDSFNDEDTYIKDDFVPYVSRSQEFKNFIMRANRYSPLEGLSGEENKSSGQKIVLLEDFPSFIRRDPSELHVILRQYRQSHRGYPMVIIVSETSKDDFSRSLMPDDVAAHVGVDVVYFNPAASMNLVKVLRSIATVEAQTGVRKFAVPDKEALMALAESSGGDIRGAINALQFACLQGVNGRNSLTECFSGHSNVASSKKSARKRSSTSQKGDAKKSKLASIGGKDSCLDLFHGMGKILYNKREESTESYNVKHSLKRKCLQNSPEELLDKVPMSEDSLNCFLHQNYADFFSKMDDLSLAAEHISLADGFFNEWTTGGKVSLTEYGGLVSVRGLCYANTEVVKQNRMRTFQKPEWYQKNRIIKSRSLAVNQSFSLTSLPLKEIATVVGPFTGSYYPNRLPRHLMETFSFFPRQQSTFVEPAALEPIEEKEEGEGEEEDFLIEEVD